MISHKTNAEWFTMIQECRSSGLTDKDWCRQHGVSVNTFYYNVKKLKKLAFTIPVPNSRQSVPKKQEIVSLTVTDGEKAVPGCNNYVHPFPDPSLSFIIKRNGISITCPDGISASTICSVVHALLSECQANCPAWPKSTW